MAKKLKYTVAVQNGWNDIVVNIPMGLSIQERKLHRSCLEYQINGGYIYDTNNNCQVKIGVAPDTWPVRSSIRRVRDAWLKMHKELFTQQPQLKPKWHDFKMMLTQAQSPDTRSSPVSTYNVPEDIFDQNLPYQEAGINWSLYTTEDGQGTPVVVDGSTEGLPSTDKDEYTCHLLGSHLGNDIGTGSQQIDSVGALKSWVDSREDLWPNTLSASDSTAMQNDPINMLFNDGDADNEIIDNLHNADPTDGTLEGDIFPPYHNITPCDRIMEVASAKSSSGMPISYFTGFKSLLGQVYLRIKSNGSGNMDIIFDVEPKGMKI